MKRQDLKHAIISLVIGVVITALSSLVEGALHLTTHWLSGIAGGTGGTVSYLGIKHHLL